VAVRLQRELKVDLQIPGKQSPDERKAKEKTAMRNPTTEVENAINQRATKILFGVLVMALLGLVSPTAVLAQLPAGLTVVTTTLAPTTALVTDPLTGLTQSQTTREVVVDMTANSLTIVSCTFEPVTINGKLNFHFKTVTTSSGRMNEETHSNSNGSGIGSMSGVKYVYSHTNDETASFDSIPDLHETTISENEHLIRQGETIVPDDLYLKFLLHMTIVHGVPVVTNVTFDSGCR